MHLACMAAQLQIDSLATGGSHCELHDAWQAVLQHGLGALDDFQQHGDARVCILRVCPCTQLHATMTHSWQTCLIWGGRHPSSNPLNVQSPSCIVYPSTTVEACRMHSSRESKRAVIISTTSAQDRIKHRKCRGAPGEAVVSSMACSRTSRVGGMSSCSSFLCCAAALPCSSCASTAHKQCTCQFLHLQR